MLVSKKVPAIKESVNKGVDYALSTIVQKFEKNGYYLDNLSFHDSFHTRDVVSTTNFLLKETSKINSELLNEKCFHLARLAAAFHDIAQDYYPKESFIKDIRQVLRINYVKNDIENEHESSFDAECFMLLENEANGFEVFTFEDRAIVCEAIESTFAYFNNKTQKFVLPKLSKQSSLIARVIVLADAYKPGLDTKGALEDSDKLFRELNLDIIKTTHDQDYRRLSDQTKNDYKARIIRWNEMQARYFKNNANSLDQILDGAEKELLQVVKNLFTHFDETIAAAEDTLFTRETMSPDEVLKDIGYLPIKVTVSESFML